MKYIIGYLTLLTALFYFAGTSPVSAQNADGYSLLTENGSNNSQYSSYKDAPILKTGGTYYATPTFENAVEMGENGSIITQTPFSQGVLTNGDASYDYKRRPMPYAYWMNTQKATLIFDLKKRYYISKVRINVLMTPKVHGIGKIGIYTWDEMLEAGSQPMLELKPKNGWNEFSINKMSDMIKLDFTRLADCPYMTISEVEIWGKNGTTAQMEKPSVLQTIAPSRNYQAFDFGPAGSPVFDDFTPVDAETVYTKSRGYGWIPFTENASVAGEATHYGAGSAKVPGLLERDRGKEIPVYDALTEDFCGSQRANHPQLKQQFAVDLKNGKYLVYLTSSDLAYGKIGESKMTVDAEGKRVINSVRYGNDLTATVQFDVTVTDGQLNLVFSSDEAGLGAGWNVSGLCVFPAGNAIEEEAALKAITNIKDEINAERKTRFISAFKKVEHKEPNQLFSLTKAQNDRGYLLFARDWMKMIYPNTVPLQREVDNTNLILACAPGEYEPASLGIYPLAKSLEANVEMSDLISDRQDKISRDNISIRLTGYLNERMRDETRTVGDDTYYLPDSSWGNSYMEKVPKILLPCKGTFSIGETKQVWLTVHVPDNAKPGQYKGTLTFQPQGHPSQTVSVTLTVYPIKLLKSNRIEGMYWNDTPRYFQNRREQLDDMARHGIRSVVLGSPSYSQAPGSPINPELKKENGKVIVDFTQMDALVKDVQDAGLTGPMPFFTGVLEGNIKRFLNANPDVQMTQDQAYQFVIAQTYQHAKEKHWAEIFFYPVDEIGNNPERMAKLKHLGALIRAADKNAKIYCTVNGFAAGVECADYIDDEVVNIPLSQEQEQTILGSGKNYMRYGNSYNYNPRISRTVSGFGFWRIPATAMFYWHYQEIAGDPYNALDGVSRDWVSSYPSPEGPVDSIDFEAIREGIDDLNYIYTMQTLMKKAKLSGKANAAVEEGQAILDEITRSDPSYSQYDLAGVPDEKYNEWRSRMAETIMKLQIAVD